MIQMLTLPTSAVEYIRKQIILGKLPPGQRLSEECLAAELNISRPPLREAFRLLESERLVENFPRKGTFVSKLSGEDLDDLYQVREMMECRAMDLLEIRNIRILPHIEIYLEPTGSFTSIDCMDSDIMMQHVTLSSNFHNKLVEAARNSRLAHFYKAISSSVMRYKMLFLCLDSEFDSGKEHHELVELIGSGAYSKAKEFLIHHIQTSYNLLQEEMAKRNE